MIIKICENLSIKRIIIGLLLIISCFFCLNYFVFAHSGGIEKLTSKPFDDSDFVDINTTVNIKQYKKENYRNDADYYAAIRNELAKYDAYVHKLTSANKRFRIYFNQVTTNIKIEDTVTGKEWYSSPQFENEDKADPKANPLINNYQRSPIILGYSGEYGAISYLDVYSYSVQRDIDKVGFWGEKSYSIKYTADSIQILYEVQERGFSYANFPQFISVERMKTLFEDNLNLSDNDIADLLEVYYDIDRTNPDYYKLRMKPSDMKALWLSRMYNIMYVKGGYTAEDLEIDMQMNEEKVVLEKPSYQIALEYKVTDNGLEAQILRNSIKEDKNYPLVRARLLPYFGAAFETEKGKLLIPDGSGALMDFNASSYYTTYAKQIYGRDRAYVDLVKKEESEAVNFPMYASIFEEGLNGSNKKYLSYFASIETGDAHAFLQASQCNENNSVTMTGFEFYLREGDRVVLGANKFYSQGLDKYVEKIVDLDLTVSYNFLLENESDYSSLAKKYQEYLKTRYDFASSIANLDSEIIFDISFLGNYDFKNFFLGIGYNDYASLTTYKQAEIILKTLKDLGIENIKVNYFNWKDTGFVEKNPIKFTKSKTLGSKKDYNNFLKFLKENDIELAFASNLLLNNGYKDTFDVKKYNSRAISWEFSTNYPYDLATGVFDETLAPIHTLSPNYYNNFGKKMLKQYKKQTGFKNGDYIELTDLGSILNSDFNRKKPIKRQDALLAQQKLLKLYAEDFSLKLNNPLQFALAYTDFAYNVPTMASKLEVFDNSIPFYQLVVSDLFEYSISEINGIASENINRTILRIIETGSNPSFLLTYSDTSNLLTTPYTNYYHVNYENWLNLIKDYNTRLKDLNIWNAQLKSHKVLVEKDNIYEVEYSNGVKIVLNYSLSPYIHSSGKVIPSSGFKEV